MKKLKPLTVQTILEIAQKATDQTERAKARTPNAYYLKLLRSLNVEKIVSVADIEATVTTSNHLNSLLEMGKNDVRVSKTADMETINALIEGKISNNQFISRVEVLQNVPQSFEEIYAEIKDINSSHETHLNNTADLFNRGVDYIEEVMQRILSPEYIDTFDEEDEKSKHKIADCLERLDQIHNVISSLI